MNGDGLSRRDFQSLVEAAIQAPSADNRHPHQFDQVGRTVRIWGKDDFRDAPFHRRVLLLISLGAMIENIRLRAQSLGFDARVTYFPNPATPHLAGQIEFSESSVAASELAAYIARRHTNRRFFHGPRMSSSQLRRLECDVAAVDGASLLWLDTPHARRQALALIRLAEAERFSREELHRELFSAIRFDAGWSSATEEGLAPGSLEIEPPLRLAFQALRSWKLMRVLRRLGAHRLLALRSGDAPCRFAPHLAMIATRLDLPAGALAAGEAMERVWLRVTSWNVALQPLAASTLLALDGYTDVRPAVRRRLVDGWAEIAPEMIPLLVFRMGYGGPVSLRSGRRPVTAHLLQS